ncbi:PREDICTED: zinc metalloproteinase nas-4-like [Wasmannia auropunctata]|uniref:zinc metalloproteinase nas-4-like n=1 Tax=Wasmannia auropunctata TaxID=64793 RepID=UPI0005ED6134|nr:PREDICTED: zinc metalloproteinase nas-4-like [Wasmannia auropunctata]XP_011704693.1 PREDICTED: zinc metalloproteinase nas-4-like [Wasmannia auropunctata]
MPCQLLITLTLMLLILIIFESVAVPFTKNVEEWPKKIPDKQTGARVALWTKQMNVNPEELGSYTEGDIMVPRITKRNGVTDKLLRWPDGIIPYVITGDFNDDQLQLISAAMDNYFNFTCIQFVPRTNEEDYINISSDETGCWSYVGRQGGRQEVNLQTPGCLYETGTVIHELMHTVGFWHEHTREDRDEYVDINWDNIKEEAWKNFAKADPGVLYNYDVPYDYGSVMHYTAYAFAKDNNEKTLITKDPNASIGQREAFSESDILKINKMYNCV